MSNITPMGTRRFESLAALRTAHSQLLKFYASTGETPEFQSAAIALISEGRTTGAILDAEDERLDAQQILDHWATLLYRLGVEPPDATLAAFDRSALPDLSDKPCPYKGMDPFREDDADNFFGCGRLVERLLTHLRECRLLFLTGHSGSGKSSLVLAGLVPALKRGALPGSSTWQYLPTIVPGANPLGSLSRFARLLGPAAEHPDTDAFSKDPACLKKVLASCPGGFPVIVVDQFEEIFSLCNDQGARDAFVGNLVSLIETAKPEAVLIFTLRTEFVPAVEQLESLRHIFHASLETFTSPNEGELREIIIEPAKKVGLEFRPGVVDALVHDVVGEAEPLPLLQFSLLKLWEQRDRNRVKFGSYLRLGAPRVALPAAAEKFFSELGHLDQRIVNGIFLRMVGLSDNSIATSHPVGRAALHRMEYDAAQIDEVLQKMRNEHLIRIAKGYMGRDDQIEVAHEALVQNWSRLVDWIESHRGALTVRRRLDEYAAEWVRLGRKGAGLLDEIQVEEADEWLRSQSSRELGYSEVLPELVSASREALEQRHRHELEQARALAEAERQRAEEQQLKAEAQRRLAEKEAISARRLRMGLIALTILLLIAVATSILAMRAEREAKRQRLRAVAQTLAVRAPTLPNDDGALLARQAYLFHSRIAAKEGDRYLANQVDQALRTVLSAPYFTHILNAGAGGIFSVAISPDGKRIAAGGQDGRVRVWNADHPAAQPALIQVVENVREMGVIWSIAFNPVNPLVATVDSDGSSADGEVKLWRTESGKIQSVPLPSGMAAKATSVAFSPDGKYMATGASDGSVQLWKVGSDENAVVLPRPPPPDNTPVQKSHGGRMALAFSPSGVKLAAGGRDGGLSVWNLQGIGSQPVSLPWRRGGVTAITFCEDDETLAAGGQDGLILVWKLTQLNEPQATLVGHKRAVSSLSYNTLRHLLASSGWDGSVYIRRLGEKGDGPDILRSHGGGVTSTVFAPNGALLISGSVDGVVGVYEIQDQNVAPQIAVPRIVRKHASRVTSVSFSGDGRLRASGAMDGSVTLVDLHHPETSATVLKGGNGAVRAVTVSPDKQKIAAGHANGTVSVWDLGEPNQSIRTFPGEEGVYSVCFNSKGTRLAAGTLDGTVRIYDTANPSAAPTVVYGDQLRGILSVAFIEGDSQVLGGSWDGTVRVWDLRAPATEARLLLRPDGSGGTSDIAAGTITSVAFSQDGLTMVANFADGKARLFDLRNPSTPPLIVPGRQTGILSVARSPDGHKLAVGRGDKTVQVWDPRKPDKGRLVLRGHESFAIALAFSAEAQTLISSSTTETLWSWIGPTEKLAEEVCKKVWRANFSPDEWSTWVGQGVPYERTCPER